MSGACCLATPVGKLRLTWRRPGRLAGLELPAGAAARRRATAPPAWLRPLAAALVAALRGDRRAALRLSWVDWTGVPPFHRRVYEFVHGLPSGRTMTYGAVARAVGRPGAARAVGQAMARNPFPLIVPCHRVVAAQGLGGFGAGLPLKRRLLRLEAGTRAGVASATHSRGRRHAPAGPA